MQADEGASLGSSLDSSPASSPRRATIADIARQAGVSPGAVSFALNGRPGVSAATRERILAIARQNNWRPSTAARALVGARAGVIGLVVARPARSLGTEAFFTDLLAGIQSALSPHRMATQLRIATTLDDELDIHREWHASQRVDGVLLLDPREDDPRYRLLNELGLPAIALGSRPARAGEPATVWLDDAATAAVLFDYLRALGHRRIAYVSGPATFEHVGRRTRTLERLPGIAAQCEPTDYAPTTAGDATRRILSAAERPSAIVYDNDVMAAAGLRVLEEMGLAVPASVSVASFDDSVMAALLRPTLTAMTRDTFALGERATELLLAQVAAGREMVPSAAGPGVVLTVRESTGVVRGG